MTDLDQSDSEHQYGFDTEEEIDDEKYRCNLCLDTFDFEELSKCPYKLCPNDHYYHGSCVEQYIKSQSEDYSHVFRYFPQDMCLTIHSRSIYNDSPTSLTISCPDCRKRVNLNGYVRLERSRIYEQIIKGNISDECTLGRKISAIRKVNKQLKDRIEEMHDAKTIYDDMIEKYTDISRDYDTELIMTQEQLNEIDTRMKIGEETLADLEIRKEELIEGYKKTALDTIEDELNSKKQNMKTMVDLYKDKCDREIERYQKLKTEEYDSYLDLQKRIYIQKNKILEEEYRSKEDILIKTSEKLDKDLADLYVELETKKDEAVWEYVEGNDLIDRFIDLAIDRDREKYDAERKIKIKAMNDAVDKRREELMVKLSREFELKRQSEIKKLDRFLANMVRNKK